MVSYLRKLWPDFQGHVDDNQIGSESSTGPANGITKEDMKLLTILAHQQLHSTHLHQAPWPQNLDEANNNHVVDESQGKKRIEEKSTDQRYRVETPSLLSKPVGFSLPPPVLDRPIDVFPATNALTSYDAYDNRPCGKGNKSNNDNLIDDSHADKDISGFTILMEEPSTQKLPRSTKTPTATITAATTTTATTAKTQIRKTLRLHRGLFLFCYIRN